MTNTTTMQNMAAYTRNLALMATCLASSALATIDMTVRYTDNMIDGMCDASSYALLPAQAL